MRTTPARFVFCLSLFALCSLPAMASPARIIAETPFLDGPAADYRQIGSLDQGTRVDVLWCGTRDDYCLIDRNGKKGWVPASVLMAISAGAAQHGVEEGSGKSTPAGTSTTDDGKHAMATETSPHHTGLTITTVKPLTFTK